MRPLPDSNIIHQPVYVTYITYELATLTLHVDIKLFSQTLITQFWPEQLLYDDVSLKKNESGGEMESE